MERGKSHVCCFESKQMQITHLGYSGHNLQEPEYMRIKSRNSIRDIVNGGESVWRHDSLCNRMAVQAIKA